ncbi:hypothetical protein C9J21_18160 [Photobacterium phosphoreum]|uniref:hypothetical protein n=1 Tax=Photobacterium phosphoreum TaxID=659 RepID=UPI000D17DE93|nr:hypothetical protein [Photobacterium phosphoreum]PSW30812.1 hypothetical protein C9J21_18160 [Photobacterium phosphoreum]
MTNFQTTSGMSQSLVKTHTFGKQQLDANSVMLVENPDNIKKRCYIVGEAAIQRGEASREFGTRFSNQNWVRTIAARLVLSLGAGSHTINLALVVNSDTVEDMTGNYYSNTPTETTIATIKSCFSDLYFVTGDTANDAIKHCHVEFNKIAIVSEIDAATKSIPQDVRKAILIQCGYGDTQLTTVVNGDNGGRSFRKGGLHNAINNVASALENGGYSKSAVLNGWIDNVAIGSDIAQSPYNFTEVKELAIKDHFEAVLPELTQPYGDDFALFNGVVVSGGAANDPIVVSVLQNYFGNLNKKLFTIDELCGENGFPSPENKDLTNSTAAVYGAFNFINETEVTQVSIDAGNGWSKSAVRQYNK